MTVELFYMTLSAPCRACEIVLKLVKADFKITEIDLFKVSCQNEQHTTTVCRNNKWNQSSWQSTQLIAFQQSKTEISHFGSRELSCSMLPTSSLLTLHFIQDLGFRPALMILLFGKLTEHLKTIED